MQRILIVEDDDNILEMLMYALSSSGFITEGVSDGAKVYEEIQAKKPDLILLDIMLPNEDGISILKKLKKNKKYDIPVIMLTAKGTEIDKVKGLDLGADDYITKPFSVMEVISRVKAVLRRCGAENKYKDLQVGNIILNQEKRTIFVDEEEIILTYKEFELLNFLMINEGIVLSRDKLLYEIWGFDYGGETRTVDMHIKTLRQKLKNEGNMIKTIRNVGYKIGG